MYWENVLSIIIIWNFIGGLLMLIIVANNNFSEVLSPKYIHNYFKVNWFGAIIISISRNLLCPVLSICVWFYKLCTIGRR
jgi:hypothetical protein